MSEDRTKDAATAQHRVGAETRSMQGGQDPLIGKTIDGKYVIEALIGAGGMGKVYRGRNTRTDSPVAIKTLLPNLVVDDTLVRRFEVEAKAASNLRHPNTIRIFDFGQEGDVLFMVMELLDGVSLEQLLGTEKMLTPARTLHIVREVAKSLGEAHEAGLVHRDIKPDNIFLNRVGAGEDHVKVLDFGVAKLQHNQYNNATLTQAGMIFGTPRYMSPEQARAHELDGRSDIYALGIIMYEAITGQPPFVGDDPVSVLIQHVNEPPKPFRQVNPSLPEMPDLEALVMRCIAKDPDERFDDVRNLLNAIDGVAPMYGLAGAVGSGPFAPARTGSTVAFDAGPNTPDKPQVKPEAFETLGVSSGAFQPNGGAADPSRYTMGADRTDVPSGTVDAIRNSPVGRVAIALGALVLIAGVALVMLVGGGGDDPVEPAATPDAPTPNAPVAPAPVAIAPVVEVASFKVRDAAGDAVAAVAARVVRMELTTDPSDISATASVVGMDGSEVTLPHTFVFTRDPNSPPAQVRFRVVAEGYRDAEHEAPLAATADPIVVSMRRRSSGGGGSRPSGGAWVPPPRDRGNGGSQGFEDPYQ